MSESTIKKPVDNGVNIIGFIQDEFNVPEELKKPLPLNYLSDVRMPDSFRAEMMKIENAFVGEDENIHFSPDYNPDPYIIDNKVFLHMGDKFMNNEEGVFKKMTRAIEMLKELEVQS